MSDKNPRPDSDHWLVRPGTIRKLWVLFISVLILTVLPDFVIHQHEEFGVEGFPAFFAVYGFLTCVAMVLFAKLLGVLVKRGDTFYE